jgi:hypothetical protein
MSLRFENPIRFRYFTDLVVLYVTLPFFFILPLATGLLAITFFAVWGIFELLAMIVGLNRTTEEVFAWTTAIFVFVCIGGWLMAIFVAPRYRILEARENQLNPEEKIELAQYIESLPIFNLMFAYGFLSIFFVYLAGEYYLTGTFFKPAPPSFWNTLASGINILVGNYISEFVEGTKTYTFTPYDESILFNKIIVKVTQVAVIVGLIKRVFDVVRSNDAAYKIDLKSAAKDSGEKET